MKNVALIFTFALVLAGSSCKKSYTCTCSYTTNNNTFNTTVQAFGQTEATQACLDLSNSTICATKLIP